MERVYHYIAILIALSALFAYVNRRFIKLPFVIGLFFLTNVVCLVAILSRSFLHWPYDEMKSLLFESNIGGIILEIFLGFLLFAGALHTNWHKLRMQLKKISALALVGVILSTVIIAVAFYYVSHWVDIEIPFIYCLIFGALISPTDPIAVLGILKDANVPEKIETTIVGESLFNDGIGVVIFIALVEMLKDGSTSFDFGHFSLLFLQEAVGGIGFGLILGYILFKMMKSIDHYETEVLLTISFVMIGYYISNQLHFSGALAMVVMGLMVGNFRKDISMSDTTQEYVSKFWELMDVVLNAILFIMIALVVVMVDLNGYYFLLAGLSILLVVASRGLIVFGLRKAFPKQMDINGREGRVITWAGLRGGLSIALVLSLPNNEYRDILLVVTYCCVVFSILVQGMTIGPLAKRILKT